MPQIPLTKGRYAIVDEGDFARVAQYKWVYSEKGNYAHRTVRLGVNKRATLKLHRMIMSARRGVQIDHVDGNQLDCRRLNLRPATRSQNAKNRKLNANNTSGFKGVRRRTGYDQWFACISANGRRVFLGQFDTPIEAAKAYNVAALKYHGAFARLNVIPEGV